MFPFPSTFFSVTLKFLMSLPPALSPVETKPVVKDPEKVVAMATFISTSIYSAIFPTPHTRSSPKGTWPGQSLSNSISVVMDQLPLSVTEIFPSAKEWASDRPESFTLMLAPSANPTVTERSPSLYLMASVI